MGRYGINLVTAIENKLYSSSHIVQITDFLEFLHEYGKENSETCTKFRTSFVVYKNINKLVLDLQRL